jgi:hypothetical protein
MQQHLSVVGIDLAKRVFHAAEGSSAKVTL